MQSVTQSESETSESPEPAVGLPPLSEGDLYVRQTEDGEQYFTVNGVDEVEGAPADIVTYTLDQPLHEHSSGRSAECRNAMARRYDAGELERVLGRLFGMEIRVSGQGLRVID